MCEGFSGAEIEQAVVSSLYEAMADKKPLATEHLLAEFQRTRQGFEKMRRDLDVAALLEPRVPADADTGELRDLLAPQPRRAAARAGDEANVRRRQPRSAAYQKVGEVAAVGIAFEVWHGQLLHRRRRA